MARPIYMHGQDISEIPRSAASILRGAKVKANIGKSQRLAEVFISRQYKYDPLATWIMEYRFHATRKWRFDICHPATRVAVECMGGIFHRGGHSRARQVKDFEKWSHAAAMGWRILFFTPSDLLKPETFELVRQALECK